MFDNIYGKIIQLSELPVSEKDCIYSIFLR